MPPSLLNPGLVVEYYLATCPNWTHTNTHNHFRIEAAMTDNTDQLLQKSLPDMAADTCEDCGATTTEAYAVVVWGANERVKAAHAEELLKETRGYYQLRFLREDQPPSDFSQTHFDTLDDPLYVIWHDDGMFALTRREHTGIPLTIDDLDDLTCHYPVEAINGEKSRFSRHFSPKYPEN